MKPFISNNYEAALAILTGIITVAIPYPAQTYQLGLFGLGLCTYGAYKTISNRSLPSTNPNQPYFIENFPTVGWATTGLFLTMSAIAGYGFPTLGLLAGIKIGFSGLEYLTLKWLESGTQSAPRRQVAVQRVEGDESRLSLTRT